MPRLILTLTLGAALVALAACGGSGDPRLMNLRNTESGPDEVLGPADRTDRDPAKHARASAAHPRGVNRTRSRPEGDAIRALGGNPERAARASGDVITYASRFGVSPVHPRHAGRRGSGVPPPQRRTPLLERIFNTNVYFRAYRPLALDRYAELERLRRAGIRTPAAPPLRAVFE